MFTKEQEQFLADFADKGLDEQAAAESRNHQINLDTLVQEARTAKQAELEAQAQALIESGLQDFETKVVPTIKLSDKG